MSKTKYKKFYERNLPHYQEPGATIFFTFRLAGSLPLEALLRLNEEVKAQNQRVELNSTTNANELFSNIYQRNLFIKWDKYIDFNKIGPTWLSIPSIAKIVWESIHYRDGKDYLLDAFCIMPNHIHLVCTPLMKNGVPKSLSKIMHSLKGYTARKCNEELNQAGQFWQHESYDHLVRNSEELEKIVNYVTLNPVQAGLEPKWVYSRFDVDLV